MAKKRTSRKKSKKSPGASSPATSAVGPFESFGQRLDELPEVRSAADAVELARAELDRAKAAFADVRESAERAVGDKSAGDAVDASLEFVRRHPGGGVLISFVAGLLLGRWLHR